MRINILTPLEAPADLVWKLLHKTAILRYLVKPLLSEGRTTAEVCRVTGYSPGWVRQIALLQVEEDDFLRRAPMVSYGKQATESGGRG